MKNQMRYFSLLLVICIMVQLFSVQLFAAEVETEDMSEKSGTIKEVLEEEETFRETGLEEQDSMISVTPIFEDNENVTEVEMEVNAGEASGSADDGESGISAAGANATDDSVYYEDLKIWFNPGSGMVTGADSDIVSLDLPDAIDGVKVTTVKAGAFRDCKALTTVRFPDSVISIGYIGDWYDTVSDDGVFRNCKNLSEVSLGNGISRIGSDAFSGCTSLENIYLPDSVKEVGCRAFSGCTALKTVRLSPCINCLERGLFQGCTALEEFEIPEGISSIGAWAFKGCTALNSVIVPDSLTSIGDEVYLFSYGEMYSYSGGVFADCPNLQYITIPESVTDFHENSTSSRVNFHKATVLCVKEGSEAEKYAVRNNLNYIYYFDERELTLLLYNPDGSLVTDGYSVLWYEHDSDVPLANGRVVAVSGSQDSYDYEISLSESLLEDYEKPLRQRAELQKMGNGYMTEFTLTSRDKVTVSGTVTDEEGESISGAVVIFQQTFEGKQVKSVTVTTDDSGCYAANLVNVPTVVSCYADGYAHLEGTDVAFEGAACTIAAMQMKRLPAGRIRLVMEKTFAAEELGRGKTEAVTSCGGMEFSLYNQTRGKEIVSFEAQYPYLYIDESEVRAGEELCITAADVSHTLLSASTTVTFSDTMAVSCELSFTTRGSFTVAVDKNAAGLVFDSDGKFVAKYVGSSALTSEPLLAGTYSLVVLLNTPVFSGVSSMDMLDTLGLKEGTDYLAKTVQIADGVITNLGAVRVSDFDASSFSYTVPDATGCASKKDQIAVGSLLSVRMEYAIKDEYSSEEEKVILDLPEGLSVISGSLTVDGVQTNYLTEDCRIIAKTGKKAAVIRFYVSASDAGQYHLNTYISFKNGGKAAMQPIGTAEFTATELSLKAAAKTGSRTAVVSGSAFPKSLVRVYDNNVPVATVTANSVGLWSVRFDLVNPGSCSRHNIYAEIASIYDVKYRTAVHEMTYDDSYCDLKRITMVHSGSEVVLEPFEAGVGTLSYSYNPTASFSFKAEFTKDNVGNVQLEVTGANGSVSYVDCAYDRQNDCYIASYSGAAVAGVAAIYDQPGVKSTHSFTGMSGQTEGRDYAYSPVKKGSVFHEAGEGMTYGIVDTYPKMTAAGRVTLCLDGRLFEPNLSVSLGNGKTEYAAQKVYWVNHQTAYAEFDLADADDGVYSVTATCGETSDTLKNSLTVDSTLEEGKGSISINLSESVKTGASCEGSITVKNIGYTDIYAPVLKLSGSNLKFKFDKEGEYVGEGIVFVQNREGLSGTIAPGETASINFTYVSEKAGEFGLTLDDYSSKRGDLYGKISLSSDSEVSDVLTANMLSLIGCSYQEYTKSMADMASALGTVYDGDITVELLEAMYEQDARGGLGETAGFSVVDLAAGGLDVQRTFSNSLHRKRICGAFGLGWTNDYDLKAEYLKEDGEECILLTSGDAVEFFVKDPEKGIFVEAFAAEDTAERRADGTIVIRLKSGISQNFGSDGLREAVSDVYGNTVRFTYEDGMLSSITNASGDSLYYSWMDGKVSTVVSSVTGDEVTYRYDGDYLASVTTKYGTTTYHYDKSSIGGKRGTLTGVDYPDGTGVSYTYDKLGRLAGTSDETGTVQYTYGLNQLTVTDEEGNILRECYDALGNLLWNVDAYGDVCYYEYDGYTCLTKESFGLFYGVSYQYDGNGRLSSVKISDGKTAGYSYDTHGGIAGITDQMNHTVRYDEDENGRLVAIVYPDGSSRSYTYDKKGNLATATDCGGAVIRYTYDDKNRLICADFDTGNKISYTYNDKGELTGIDEDGNVTAITYDERGGLKKITYPNGKTVSYGYDSLGRRTSVTDSEGNVTRYEYDENSRLAKVSDGGTAVISYTYNKDDTISEQQNANGTYTTYAYRNGRLSEICNYGADGNADSQFSYSYDKFGRISAMETLDGIWKYEYDMSGQLVKATAPDGKVTEYEYDAAGNRISVTADGRKTDYTVNNMNQYLTGGNVTRSYDANGHLKTEVSDNGTASYEWDYCGRLKKLTTEDGHTYEYEYDIFGGRSKVTVDGVSTEYVNDPTGGGYALTAYAGGEVTRYLVSGGIAAMDAGTGLYFYSFNHLGSTVGLTAPDGTLANSYFYDQEGNVLTRSEAVWNPYTYVGAYGIVDDGNGLWYDRARYVSQTTDSFISMDPAAQYYDLNMYRYVGNDAVNYVDVTGEEGEKIFSIYGEIGPEETAGWDTFQRSAKKQTIPEVEYSSPKVNNSLNPFSQSSESYRIGKPFGYNVWSGNVKNDLPEVSLNKTNQYVEKASKQTRAVQQTVKEEMIQKTKANAAEKIKQKARQEALKKSRNKLMINALKKIGVSVLVGIAGIETGVVTAIEFADIVWTVGELVHDWGEVRYITLDDMQDDTDDSSIRTVSVIFHISFVVDPSGYVYEGVTSNRLEGVRAVIYYEGYPTDEFGQPDETAGLGSIEWVDAEDYNEINPQYTNSNGEYGWDVPCGRWKVKFSKEGYEDYETDWMEVPPEYTDVNINLKNLAAPIVETVNVYSDCVQLIFSQYMDVGSVTSDVVTVQMGGREIDGTVVPIDEGYDYGEKSQCAKIFEFYPDETLSGEVTVRVEGACSYCGNEMKVGQRTSAVAVKPEKVLVSAEDCIAYGSTVPMSIDIAPGEAGSFKSVEITARTPAIADADLHRLSLDKNGHAEVSVFGKMPGVASFEIKVRGTALSCIGTITVSDLAGEDSPPTPPTPPTPPVSESTDLSGCDAVLEYESAAYTGRALEPAVTVTYKGVTLAKGTDYTVAYANNVNAGTASVSVAGQGNYSGTIKKSFTISKAKNVLTLPKGSYSYQASASKTQTFSLGASASGGVLSYGSNSRFVMVDKNGKVTISPNFAGTAVITITVGNNNYETVTKTVTVKVNQIKNTITASDYKKTVSKKVRKFYIKARRSGSGKLSYSSNNKSVSVNSRGKVTIAANFVGRAEIKIKVKDSGIYKSAVKTITITVNPANTKIVSVGSPSSRKLKVKWKKNTAVTGYQIQYADNKKYKKAVTKTISRKSVTTAAYSGLKTKKLYYVRIRTYKKVSGKRFYSSWSSPKRVRIK